MDEARIFERVRRGDTIFIGTACGEPQHLVAVLESYVEGNPQAIVDAEVLHVWSLGLAPYATEKLSRAFRHNSFFIGATTREAVNAGLADYTPIFLSQIPGLFESGRVPIDVALVQVSPPDAHGYMSLGISVDITKAAVEAADVVVAQVNRFMPRVHGNCYIHVDEVDYLVEHDEPLLEYADVADDEAANRIGSHVARLIQDGDTIQVGYGSIPNAILAHLEDKRHLGVHTELLSDGLIDLIEAGVIDNTRKSVNRGKTVATFCMGSARTYAYLDNNPSIEFRTVDFTNSPLTIARQERMTAINSALEVDLTGQATAESIGSSFYSGIGGQADFMRGAILSSGGKSIQTLPSVTSDGSQSRITAQLSPGAGVTLNRGDIHYVVTEYGIAYIHGKNVRERAMELIRIAHPSFRGQLIDQAKESNLIYRDQAFVPGKRGEYPQELESYLTVGEGDGRMALMLRPVRISDEPILKDFFYDLSDQSLYRRFIQVRKRIPHEMLQEFVVIDYSTEMVILAVEEDDGAESVVGIGQYAIDERTHAAEVAFVVRDDLQQRGIGRGLLRRMTVLAKNRGLLGFTAEVLLDNRAMLHLFETFGFDIDKRTEEGVYLLRMTF